MQYDLYKLLLIIENLKSLDNNTFNYLIDNIFVSKHKDKNSKFKYIKALPKPGTNFIESSAYRNDDYLSKNMQYVIVDKSVNIIKASAFNSCFNLKYIKLQDNIKSIGSKTFYFCINLKNINLPKSLDKISGGLFENSGLEKIDIENNILSIGQHSFNNCIHLKEVKIGNSIKSIKEWAFANTGLNYIKLGNSIETISTNAFRSRIRKNKYRYINKIELPSEKYNLIEKHINHEAEVIFY